MARVVITGIGAMSALGHSATETLTSLANGVCGIGPLEIDNAESLTSQIGGQIRNFDPEAHFNRRELVRYDPFTQYALLAAREAIKDCGLTFEDDLSFQTGVILGTSAGGLHIQEQSYRAIYQEKKDRIHPFLVPRSMNSAACSYVSMEHNLRGPSFSVSTACSSSNHAMGLAFQMVRSGSAKVMLTGGSESLLFHLYLKAWEGLRVMSSDACRPFSRNRSGLVQGEGAGIFIFEEYEHAKARGAPIYAEVAGFGMSADAHDIVMPSQEGAARAISGAVRDAQLPLGDVSYINAHGSGTLANDRMECAAIMDVFGPHAQELMISSTKSMHGHLIGGTGAVELLACIMALKDGIVAPTIGYQEPDPECPLDVVPNEAREAPVKAALSNSFAFGGLNAVLALKKV